MRIHLLKSLNKSPEAIWGPYLEGSASNSIKEEAVPQRIYTILFLINGIILLL